MTAVVDPGRVINPLMVEGQIEGGLDMGAGMALREEYVHGETKDWVTFKFPTIRHSFETEIILIQTPRLQGTAWEPWGWASLSCCRRRQPS